MKRSTSAALVLWALLVGLAFAAAPHSCEWGFSAYTWTGVIMLIGLPVLTLVLPTQESGGRRALRVLAMVAGTVSVWAAGLFLANVRVMCRLF